MNEFFHNVCELDLVFNFYKVKTTHDTHTHTHMHALTAQHIRVTHGHALTHTHTHTHTKKGLCSGGRDVSGRRDKRDQSI